MNLINLKRWIKASAIKAFKDEAGGQQLFIEGEDRRTDKSASHLELRIDGPYCTPNGSKGEWRAYVEINVLVNSTRNQENIYDRENLQGISQQMLNRDICVYKIGNVGTNDADDESLFGVLQLMPGDQIKLSDFGNVDDHAELYQAVAEAHYTMYFSE